MNQISGSDVRDAAVQQLIGDKEKAKEILKFALPAAQKRELSYDAAFVLGDAAAKTKDMKAAEIYMRVCADKAAKLQSLSKLADSYGTLIDYYNQYKQYGDTVRLCKELADLNTDDAKNRTVIQTASNEDGETEFEKPQKGFLLADRLRVYVYQTHVKALAKQGKYDQAIQKLDKEEVLIEPYTLGLKGWVLREAGKLDDAADVYEKAINELGKDKKFEIGELQFRYEVSNVYIDLKKIDEAAEHLEYLIKKRPESPVFYNDLGYVWADNNMKLKEAEKMIRKALELDRDRRKKRDGDKFDPNKDHDSGAYLDSLGWVLFKQKKTEQAKKWLSLAVEDKASRHIEIYDHLGDVLMALGEREAAVRAWEEGLKFVNEGRRDAERKASVEKKLEKAKGTK